MITCVLASVRSLHGQNGCFDKNLNWNGHANKIYKKISKVLAIMNRLKAYLPAETLLIIYNSLIMSHFIYGILLWGKRMKTGIKLQKRAIRIICKEKYNAHTDPLFKKLDILKLPDILSLQEWKFYYKLVHRYLPSYFLQIPFLRQFDLHQYATRQNNQIVTPRLKYQLSLCSIKNRLPNMINQAPQSTIDKIFTHSLYGLCFYLKRVFVSAYNLSCLVPDCYVCRR